METLLQHLLNGTSLGAIYALLALGYTLVYGILRLINFAHGDIFMMGAFAGLYAAHGLSAATEPSLAKFSLVLLLAMTAAGLLGLFIERLAYRPLRKSPRINLLMTAVGVSLFLENMGQIAFGATPRQFPEVLPESVLFTVAGVDVSNHQATVLLTATALMLVLEWVIHSTRVGRAMRAVSFSHEIASLVGIPVDRVIAITFCIGSALAAAAGILLASSYPKVDPFMGVMPGLKAFVAAVLGGIGSIRGAMVGALIMGVAEEMVAGYFSSTYRDALAFGILILILLVKPAGLFGKYEPEKV